MFNMHTIQLQFKGDYIPMNYSYSPTPTMVEETTYSPISSPPESITSDSTQYSDSPSPINQNFNMPNHPVAPYYQAYPDQHAQQTYKYPQEPTPRLSRSRTAKNSQLLPKQTKIAHPYARLFAKKDETKRRKIWNHALEKSIFSPLEISTVGAPNRRKIYIASLEAHIDRLHAQLLEIGFWPVAFSELDPFKGLNFKTAKSMVAGLQYDASVSNLKLLELERANGDLQKILSNSLAGRGR